MTDLEVLAPDAKEDGLTLLDIDLRQYESKLTGTEARELVRELAYLMLYEVKDDSGLPHGLKQAHTLMLDEYDWLIAITGWTYNEQTLRNQADKHNVQLWEKTFDGRTKLAAIRFRNRILEIDQIMPIVMNAIRGGDLGAVDKYVSLAKLDMEASGYGAPTKYELSAGSGDDIITEQDKERVMKATQYVDDWKKGLLPEKIEEGEYEVIDEDE